MSFNEAQISRFESQLFPLIENYKGYDWNITQEYIDNRNSNSSIYYDLNMYSNAGQDFHVAINIKEPTVKCFCSSLRDAFNNFDSSEEASLWLDNTGHGKNGAPYSMKDIFLDMEQCNKESGKLLSFLESAEKQHNTYLSKPLDNSSFPKLFLHIFKKEAENMASRGLNFLDVLSSVTKEVLSYKYGNISDNKKLLGDYLKKLGVCDDRNITTEILRNKLFSIRSKKTRSEVSYERQFFMFKEIFEWVILIVSSLREL